MSQRRRRGLSPDWTPIWLFLFMVLCFKALTVEHVDKLNSSESVQCLEEFDIQLSEKHKNEEIFIYSDKIDISDKSFKLMEYLQEIRTYFLMSGGQDEVFQAIAALKKNLSKGKIKEFTKQKEETDLF